MLPRRLTQRIRDSLGQFPAVALIGPRQVGKTTLAMLLAKELDRPFIHLDLERPADAALLREPEAFLQAHQDDLLILDEIQVRSDLFPLFRWAIDAHRRPGRFLMLGSASGDLLHHSSESLAGRIVYHELTPLLFSELPDDLATRNRLWLRGGFPLSFLSDTDLTSRSWRDAFLRSLTERDIPQLGMRTPAPQWQRLLQMLAHCHGQIWNASRIAQSMDLSVPAIGRYLHVLEETFMVRRLLPFHANLGKRLVKSPKIYLRDSGLLHQLLGLGTYDDLLGHPVLGESWEGWVIEQVIGNLPPYWEAYYYRTHAGAEIDLLLLAPGGQTSVAIDIKFSSSPVLSRGFYQAIGDLGCSAAYVIYPGEKTFALDRQVRALAVKDLGQIWA